MQLLAALQRMADANAHVHHIPQGDDMAGGVFAQGGEQLHLDENIPSKPVSMGLDFVVLVVDDVGVPLHLGHHGDLPHAVLYDPFIIFRHIRFTQTLTADLIDLRTLLRNGDDLQRRVVCIPVLFPRDLIHHTKGASANLSDDLPISIGRLHLFHPLSTSPQQIFPLNFAFAWLVHVVSFSL